MHPGAVKANALLKVLACRYQLTLAVQNCAQHAMCPHEARRPLLTLSQCKTLFRQFTRSWLCASGIIKRNHTCQYGEQLRGIAQLLTQFPCPGIDVFHLRCGIALGDHQ